MQRLRAFALVAPLLFFVILTFVAPIVDMLFRSVENGIVSETLPRTVVALRNWNHEGPDSPDEDVFRALYVDFSIAFKLRRHTRVGSRLNYESAGIASQFRRGGRALRKIDAGGFSEHFVSMDGSWGQPSRFAELFAAPDVAAVLPQSAAAFTSWQEHFAKNAEDRPEDFVYVALAHELGAASGSAFADLPGPVLKMLQDAARGLDDLPSLKAAFVEQDDGWQDSALWRTIKTFSPKFTEGYFLNAVDLKKGFDGPELRDESERLYILIFGRTMAMSLAITLICALLGYPVAYYLAHLPMRRANMLLILVLLPFWTSLLVRTSAWKVLLQQEGVINDFLVLIGAVADSDRLVMINNQFGTIVAMSHILLPFMILPLYSVMKTIPPSYVRAARSLGANAWTAFRRVYFPQSLPGIGAGSILVFILAVGYYITPELVGGTKGTFISNRIAYHISASLNWGLGAALATLLLVVVLLLYWVYDRVVGIDQVKLG